MGWSFKKPLGNNPVGTVLSGATLGLVKPNAFKRGQVSAPPPVDPNQNTKLFNDTGIAEQGQIGDLAKQGFQQLTDFGTNYKKTAGADRQALLESLTGQNKGILDNYSKMLTDQGTEALKQANPAILEDLNKRGFLSSQSEVANAEARAQAGLQSENQRSLGELAATLGQNQESALTNFDTNSNNRFNDINSTAMSGLLSGNQDALSAALDMKRMGLQDFTNTQGANQQQAYETYLAKKKRQSDLTNALIGAGAQLGGAAIKGASGGAAGGGWGAATYT